MTTEVIDIRKENNISDWKIVFSDNQYEFVEYFKTSRTFCLNDIDGDCAEFSVSDVDNLIKALQKVKELNERS